MDIGLIGQFVVNGLMLGMMYALVAVGFTLFFGVLDVIKFSHGDVLMVGAFTGFTALELRFWHHQFGVNQGTLELEVTTDGGTTWTPIWNKVGDKGDSWNEIIVDLSSYAGQTLGLRFKSTTGADFEGDVAIDDITVTGN